MKEFIEFLVKSLVKNPEAVLVDESGGAGSFNYTVTVDPSDMGLIIGKEGRTINSIRALAKAKAVREGTWIDIKLVDESFSKPEAASQDA